MTREELIEDILEAVFKGKGYSPTPNQRKVAGRLSTKSDPVSKSVFRHVRKQNKRPRRLGSTYIYDGSPVAAQRRGELSRKKVDGKWSYWRTPGEKEIDALPFAINPAWQPK